MSALDRRDFLKTSAASVAALSAVTAAGAADKPHEKLNLAVLGVRGRGRGLLSGFSSFDGVEIAAVCDPDENVTPVSSGRQAMPVVAACPSGQLE